MIANSKYYCGTAYLKKLSDIDTSLKNEYDQLAYAINDPLAKCAYNSAQLYNIYINDVGENEPNGYYFACALLRDFFYDEYSYEYNLQNLYDASSGNIVLRQYPELSELLYELCSFKKKHGCGIDKYAEYRKSGTPDIAKRLESLSKKAEEYLNKYLSSNYKVEMANLRYLKTRKLIFNTNGDLSNFLQLVKEKDIDTKLLCELKTFLIKNYIATDAVVKSENIDNAKIENIIDSNWNLAGNQVRKRIAAANLVSTTRNQFKNQIEKVVGLLSDYVYFSELVSPLKKDEANIDYDRINNKLMKNIKTTLEKLSVNNTDAHDDNDTLSGKLLLKLTLQELVNRMKGSYDSIENKYFYLPFLKSDKILLNKDYLPQLDDIPELDTFSVLKRLENHYNDKEINYNERLEKIIGGGDDYGSAELILEYLSHTQPDYSDKFKKASHFEDSMNQAKEDMEYKCKSFADELELRQSYGQIDNTQENRKEIILQIIQDCYYNAMTTGNYGFFNKVREAFLTKIDEEALAQQELLTKNLSVYLSTQQNWRNNDNIKDAVNTIKERIKIKNYAAAEDMLNRLENNDLDSAESLIRVDYLQEFLNQYATIFTSVADSGKTLKALIHPRNKDEKGAAKLRTNWITAEQATYPAKIQALLEALGFKIGNVEEKPMINKRYKDFDVSLLKPSNGRKVNYTHPIAAFGSLAEVDGFRVVCLFGKHDDDRLMDIFREIGNAKNTLVIVDGALKLPTRHALARLVKKNPENIVFAVLDRVALVYLANNYKETSVNRMLMAITMPYAYYQPYIADSVKVMPPEIFIGRKQELMQIENPNGVNIVYGGRQLGKSALLRMAQKDIDKDENGNRAVLVDVKKRDYKATAHKISQEMVDQGILSENDITDNWDDLARNIKNRLKDTRKPIKYLLLLIDEADTFIDSCSSINYQPFDALKDIQSIGTGRFKFVVAGLRDVVRFNRQRALGNNSVLAQLSSLTVKPFKADEARELLEVPLAYLGFRFEHDEKTNALIAMIFGHTNYFPGLLQLYCSKLIEAMTKKDYAGYDENHTPPYIISEDHVKKVLGTKNLQKEIRDKFTITLSVDEDDYYYIIALLMASKYHEDKFNSSCSPCEILNIAYEYGISKIMELDEEKVTALMEEMRELNVLQHVGTNSYRFARFSFLQMMGNSEQVDNDIEKYMED